MSGNGFVKVDRGFGSFESHLAPLDRGWRGLPAVRSCSFFAQLIIGSCRGRCCGSLAVHVHRPSAGMAVHLDGTARDVGQNAACLSPWS